MTKKRANGILSRIFLRRSDLPFFSGYTYYHHWRMTVVVAVAAGMMSMNFYVMQKGLGATGWEMDLMSTAAGLPYLLTPLWSQFFRRRGTHRTLSVMPFFETAPIFLMACMWLPWQFVLLTAMNVMAATVIYPVLNFAMQQNYAVGLRGRIFGQLTAFQLLVTLIVAAVTAWVMDLPPVAVNVGGLHASLATFRFVFPLAALACLAGRLMFRKLKVRAEERVMTPARKQAKEMGYLANIWESFAEMVKVFRNDRHFFLYEVGFMLHGTAIIMIVPVVPIVANVRMKASYLEYMMATVLTTYIMQLVLGPVWGAIIDRLKGPRTSLIIYVVLIISMVILWGAVTTNSTWMLAAGFVMQGVGVAGINITWNLGAVEFSKRGEIDRCTSAHVFLVGLRFLYAPTLGIAVMTLLGGPAHGARWVFLCGAVPLLAACGIMLFLGRSMARAKAARG